MTNGGFRERYQILQQVCDGPIRSSHAMAATGAVVMVHFLDPASPDNARTLALIDGLRPTERKRVIEVTELDGAPVIVTRFILDFTTLTDWLLAHQQAGPGTTIEPAPPTPGATITPPTPGAPIAPPPPESDVRPVEPPTTAPPPREPGEFTRVFGLPTEAASSPPAGPTDPEPARPEPPPPPSPPGDFTRVFGRPAAGEPPVAPTGEGAGRDSEPRRESPTEPDAGSAGPGEFTQVFRQSTGTPAPPAEVPGLTPPPAEPPGLTPPPPLQAPSIGPVSARDIDPDFRDALFRPIEEEPETGLPSFMAKPGTAGPADTYLDRLRGASTRREQQPTPPPQAPARKSSDPGEFTRLVRAAGRPQPEPPPAGGGTSGAPHAPGKTPGPATPESRPPATPHLQPPATPHLQPPATPNLQPPAMPRPQTPARPDLHTPTPPGAPPTPNLQGPAAPQGPSEFTRILSSPLTPPPQPAAAPPSVEPTRPPAPRSRKAFVIGLVAVVLFAVLLVVLLAVLGGGSEASDAAEPADPAATEAAAPTSPS